ncbi:ENTH-domain-containing protein [Coprinopsis marcescibilis]|uniref:ENTH-domain-containing protein n=1 Tax=Coprinopsis marcescibilis TaxID=230819 RepID=A0A5C3L4P3_COPMA|nr:ENTH-domain-containing protein [Coprinopsis marcescibilis]
MDKLENISSTLSNLTMYDIKSMYNQAKNVVLNVSEMEAKVREATNDDPWGASSTLMSEIAQGTFNFAQFNEIMPCIYGRFMEKEAKQWRQIYKALQLLEYLVKNGSERVVDDARSHISTLKMLRNFHYIDDKGKDEGINVRNRAKELVELLSDVEKIRVERRKAKTNRAKFIGVGNDGTGFGSGGGERYGGFGGEGGYSGGGSGSYNDQSSGGGSSSYSGGNSYSGRSYNDHIGGIGRRQFEEYDAGGDEIRSGSSSNNRSSTSTRNTPKKAQESAAAAPPPAPAAPVPNLLDDLEDIFGEPVAAPVAAAPVAPGTNKALPAVSLDDDDFSDFQPAPVHNATIASPAFAVAPGAFSAAPSAKPNLMDLLNQNQRPVSTPVVAPVMQAQPPPGYGSSLGGFGHRPSPSVSGQVQAPNYTSPISHVQSQPSFGGAPLVASQPSYSSPGITSTRPAAAPAKPASSDFGDLWSMSLASTSSKPSTPAPGGAKSMQALQKEKAAANIWGQTQQATGPPKPAAFPAFGGSSTTSASNDGDDLLL